MKTSRSNQRFQQRFSNKIATVSQTGGLQHAETRNRSPTSPPPSHYDYQPPSSSSSSYSQSVQNPSTPTQQFTNSSTQEDHNQPQDPQLMAQTGAEIMAKAQWSSVPQAQDECQGQGQGQSQGQGQGQVKTAVHMPWRQHLYPSPTEISSSSQPRASQAGAKFAIRCVPFSQRVPTQVNSNLPVLSQPQPHLQPQLQVHPHPYSHSYSHPHPQVQVQSPMVVVSPGYNPLTPYAQPGASGSSIAASGFHTAQSGSRFRSHQGFKPVGDGHFRQGNMHAPEGGARRLPEQMGSAGFVRSEAEREENLEVEQGGAVESTATALPRKSVWRGEVRGPVRVLKAGGKVSSKERLSPKEEGGIARDLNESLVKTEDDKLYFSKKSRKVAYKPYTTKQYLKTKPKTYYELGKLQADLNRSDLIERRERRNKAITCAKKFQKQNAEHEANLKKRAMERKQFFGYRGNNARELIMKKNARPKALSARERALQFAKTIPKPRVKSASPRNKAKKQYSPRNVPTKLDETDAIQASTELEELERRHDTQLMQIEQIKREYQCG